MDDTFTLLPLHMDPTTKHVSAPDAASTTLDEELGLLNITHRALLSLSTPNQVPPPPLPLNPERSAEIQKLREQGNKALTKRGSSSQNTQEAIHQYTDAIDLALKRPPWEPAGVVRDEVAILMSNRSQAYIAMRSWPEGAVDALISVEMKAAPGQGKAWWRRGRCLLEMGRLQEAKDWVDRALQIEAGDGAADLKSLLEEIDQKLGKSKKS